MLEGVITQRPTLRGVVWLLDARHPPSEDDLAIQQLLAEAGRPVLTLLTKGDKLGRAQRAVALTSRARELGLPADALLLTSATKRLGIAELRESIEAAVGGARKSSRPGG